MNTPRADRRAPMTTRYGVAWQYDGQERVLTTTPSFDEAREIAMSGDGTYVVSSHEQDYWHLQATAPAAN